MIITKSLFLCEHCALQPVLTTGERDYAKLLIPVVGAVWKRAVPTSFGAMPSLGRRVLRRQAQTRLRHVFVHRPDMSAVELLAMPGPKGRKKKGGAMNAPPLEGSDTSVSSPKRQTAEAVRCDDHLHVTMSQERSYISVIVPWNLMAVFRYESTQLGVENHAPAFADAIKRQSIRYRTESPRITITRAYGSGPSQNPRNAWYANRPAVRRPRRAPSTPRALNPSNPPQARRPDAPGSSGSPHRIES